MQVSYIGLVIFVSFIMHVLSSHKIFYQCPVMMPRSLISMILKKSNTDDMLLMWMCTYFVVVSELPCLVC